MEPLLSVLSLVALIGSGVIAGVFFAFSSFVMRALVRLPPAHGLAAMQSINITVLNPHFLGTFLGTAAISVGAIVLALVQWGQPGALLYVCGGVLYVVGSFLVTGVCNVPLNNALAKLTPNSEGAADEWARYAHRWTFWNHVRTAASLLAALSFGIGLLQG